MPDREKVIKGLECCVLHDPEDYHKCNECPYRPEPGIITNVPCSNRMVWDALAMLKAQEPRVMTLEEVVAHYSLPPVFPDDLGMQFDYLNDIQPLYFDFPHPEDPWIVHWRKYDEVDKYLDDWKPDYGKTWRCWTSRPSDEQREATPWAEPPKEGT